MIQVLPKRGRGRPPKTDAQLQPTRQRLVRAGIEKLTEQGFASTGIDQVLKQVGVPKGSFYHYFASKDVFVEAVIVGYGEYFAAKLERCLGNQDRSPLQRLHDFIEDGRQGLLRYEFKRGCLVGNLGQEIGATHAHLRPLLESVFTAWEQRVAQCLQEAQSASELSPNLDCQAMAQYFWMAWEGAILRAKLTQNAGPIDLFEEVYFAGLNQP